MKKKVIIHSIAFSPDGVSTAYLYNDIALKFANNNFDVLVLSTTPHYNIVPDELAKQPLTSKWGGIYYESVFNNIRVIHIPQKKFKSSLLRMIGFVYWHIVSLILGLLQTNISLILSPSPPITIGVINIIIGKIKGAKVIYNVQEIYPDFLINQGSLKFKPIVDFLKFIEKFVYNNSDAVTTIDVVFYNTIVNRFKDSRKLVIIPNFVDTSLFKPIAPENIILDEKVFPKEDDVLRVMYAGNLGHAQDWKPLLEVAKRLLNSKIEFWIIGEGVMKEHLEEQINEYNLSNVHLIAYQPRSQMPSLISYADLHFIFMSSEMEGQGFPSKVYTIMACAKPLLVISGDRTPIDNFLKNANCSFLVNTRIFEEKCEQVVHILLNCLSNKIRLKELGSNGYKLIESQYSSTAVTQQYLNLANRILERQP
jgi:colanic acid biosynthesis glycosyl transferase WcaI